MIFSKKVSKEEAVKIAKENNNLPQAIHEKIRINFKNEGKVGILSFIELESPIVEEVTIDGMDYFQITFLKGDISWQQLNRDSKEIEVYYDGFIDSDSLAKCLVNKENGKFEYIGFCNIGLEIVD